MCGVGLALRRAPCGGAQRAGRSAQVPAMFCQALECSSNGFWGFKPGFQFLASILAKPDGDLGVLKKNVKF